MTRPSRLSILNNSPSQGAPSADTIDAAPTRGRVAVINLGCAKNKVDSEVMLGCLKSQGFVLSPSVSEAEVAIVNTCGFLESAVQESIDTILDVCELKDGGELRKVVVAGCMVERYQEEKGASNRIERDLLASMVKARTGLFKVEGISSQRYSLELQGLVEERKVILTDINFSRSMIQGLVVFFRPIELAEFTMTSGVAFIFPEEMERRLVARWARWDQAERYARFFKLSKSKGLSTLYV